MRNGTPGKSDATVIALYTPEPQSIAINGSALRPAKRRALLFDPATGHTTPIQITNGTIAPQKTTEGDAVIMILSRDFNVE